MKYNIDFSGAFCALYLYRASRYITYQLIWLVTQSTRTAAALQICSIRRFHDVMSV